MVNAFLTQPTGSSDGTEKFVHDLVKGEGLKDVGGFSLVCGRVGEPLAIISNRTPNVDSAAWIAKGKGETVGLSNATFENKTWPKVSRGEALLSSAIEQDLLEHRSQASLIEKMWRILDDDMLPRLPKAHDLSAYMRELRKSIFIPAIGGEGVDSLRAENLAAGKSDQHIVVENAAGAAETQHNLEGAYGTQKQTVVLVNYQGQVTFVERTLYGTNGRATPASDRDRAFQFDIEGWKAPQARGDATVN